MSKAKVIHKDGLFVRKDKSRSSEWVRIIPCGEEFEFYEEYNGWLKVADGWVVCNDVYIRPTEVTAGGGGAGLGSSTDILNVVATAGLVDPVTSATGELFTDTNGNIYTI